MVLLRRTLDAWCQQKYAQRDKEIPARRRMMGLFKKKQK